MTHLKKSNAEMQEEIANLNLQIRQLKARTKLELAKGGARRASGRAQIRLAQATHARRKARFSELRDKFIAKGFPLGQAAKRASKEYRKRV